MINESIYFRRTEDATITAGVGWKRNLDGDKIFFLVRTLSIVAIRKGLGYYYELY